MNGTEAHIKKAYEISYALLRVASSVKESPFGSGLESHSNRLLEKAVRSLWDKLSEEASVAGYLIRLGSDAGLMHPASAEAIRREIEAFLKTIPDLKSQSAILPDLSIENIFTGNPATEKLSASVARESISIAAVSNNGNGNGSGNGYSAGQEERQAAILGFVRKSGNCRMKDLQEYLPNVSERTLRYDLQRLLEQEMIERGGNGGPATFYKPKSETLVSNIL